jgi:hypothetical protein
MQLQSGHGVHRRGCGGGVDYERPQKRW